MHDLLNLHLLWPWLNKTKSPYLFVQENKKSFLISIIIFVVLCTPVVEIFATCPIYYMRAGSSHYFCGGGKGVTATVAMSGSSVGYSYQLIRNGNSAIGDMVPGDGKSTMKWTVYEEGTYTVMEYGGTCNGTLMSGETKIIDLGTSAFVRINSENSNYRCQGQSISFSAQNGSGYSWYNNGQQTGVTGSTYTPSTNQPGTYTIKVQGANACGVSQSDEVTLFVGAYPTASILAQGATTFCQGGNVVLQVQSNGNYFQWFKDGQAQSETGTSYPATVEGKYTFKASFTGEDCATESAPIAVNVLSLPTATISPDGTVSILYGKVDVVLTANTGSNYTYQWYNNEQIIAGETQSTFKAIQPGEYAVKIVDGNSCSNTSLATTVIVENNYNYIRSRTVQVDAKSDGSPIEESDLVNLNEKEKVESTTYYDGLGRPMQTVLAKGSPLGNDIVQPVIYDVLGRETIKYLPYSSDESNGWYKINPVGASAETYSTSDQAKFYQNGLSGIVATNAKPYAETEFESSPLNRILKQGAPGDAWQPNDDPNLDKSIKHSYELNSEKEVILFTYDATTGTVSSGNAKILDYYIANRLQANKTKDEHNNEVIEYIDKEGHTVCKKVQYGVNTTTSAKLYASTYYIYDDFGNLVFVLPPEGVEVLVPSSN